MDLSNGRMKNISSIKFVSPSEHNQSKDDAILAARDPVYKAVKKTSPAV